MIHQYKLGGYNIVLDVCSGSVHIVDDAAYDIIAMFEGNDREAVLRAMEEKYAGDPDITAEDLAECYDQVSALRDSGRLFAPDTFEPMAGALKEKTAGVVKALCLHIAHTCNLNCAYCFASQGKYHGDRAVMSFEVGKRALDFLVENSGTRRNLEVDFFGGEPLMNFQVVKDLVAYARSIEKEKGKNFRF
ncbi:MAG: 4Fe-4S cluster-binding domain-containing protein, partial [Candidatus Enterenecus sp.]